MVAKYDLPIFLIEDHNIILKTISSMQPSLVDVSASRRIDQLNNSLSDC